MKARKLLVLPAAGALVILAACGGGGGGTGSGTGSGSGSKTAEALPASAINPQPRDAIADGGELRLAVEEFGGQWNTLNVNGNTGDNNTMMGPMLPTLFDYNDKGDYTPDPNFLSSVKSSDSSPEVVTYNLNPKAVWGSGRKIDWTDFEATWKACNGQNTQFQCASTQGYDQIASVKEGTNAQQVIVTYKAAYPDWAGTFGLFPKEGVSSPSVFNNGWKDITKIKDWLAGPFTVDSFDQTQKILTLVPSPTWWGDKPKLSKITFKAISTPSQPAAFANNEIDTFDVGVDASAFAKAKAVSDGEVRAAAGPDFRHITLNSKAGALKDLKVRQAIAQGLNRKLIAESDLAGLNEPVAPMNNHIFVNTQTGYQDNATPAGVNYDQAKAKQTLESDGYTMGSDGYYQKNGQDLTVSFAALDGIKVSQNEALQVQNQLKSVGIKVTIANTPVSKFQDGSLLTQHEFQMVAFSWLGTPYPFSGIGQIYGTGSESNFTQLSIPEVDSLVKQINVETDKTKRIELANQADKLIWENVHSIVLYQRPQNTAAKKKLANYGSFGLSSVIWQNVGFTK